MIPDVHERQATHAPAVEKEAVQRERSRTQRREPDATRDRILQAAIKEFAAEGYSGARVDAICKRARSNPRSARVSCAKPQRRAEMHAPETASKHRKKAVSNYLLCCVVRARCEARLTPGGRICTKAHPLDAAPLDGILKNLQIRTVLFSGVNTDQCVLCSLQDANFLGYGCVLLSDRCGTTSPDYCTAGTLFNVKKCFGFVTVSSAILEAL